jgi:hypothetical protein
MPTKSKVVNPFWGLNLNKKSFKDIFDESLIEIEKCNIYSSGMRFLVLIGDAFGGFKIFAIFAIFAREIFTLKVEIGSCRSLLVAV